jgi:hypothetical protein
MDREYPKKRKANQLSKNEIEENYSMPKRKIFKYSKDQNRHTVEIFNSRKEEKDLIKSSKKRGRLLREQDLDFLKSYYLNCKYLLNQYMPRSLLN